MRPRVSVLAVPALAALLLVLAGRPGSVGAQPPGSVRAQPLRSVQAGPPAVASATTEASLTLNDLVEKAAELDGREVTVAGEAVGDLLLRKGYGWINLNDGTNAVGVRAPLDLLAAIRHVGRFGVRGDVVRVTGTFYRMDPESGGDLDIRAVRLEVIRPGGPATAPVSPARVALAGVALAAAGAAGGLWWRRKSRGLS